MSRPMMALKKIIQKAHYYKTNYNFFLLNTFQLQCRFESSKRRRKSLTKVLMQRKKEIQPK